MTMSFKARCINGRLNELKIVGFSDVTLGIFDCVEMSLVFVLKKGTKISKMGFSCLNQPHI